MPPVQGRLFGAPMPWGYGPRQYPRRYDPRSKWLKDRGLEQGRMGMDTFGKGAMSLSTQNFLTSAWRFITENDARTMSRLNNSIEASIRAAKNGYDDRTLTQTNREIGAAAQRSVVAAYIRRRPQRDLPAYRAGATDHHRRRYANGALLRALQSPNFWSSSAAGIQFINTSLMNKEAAHWARLNFGTQGGAAVKPPARFEVTWGQLAIGALQLVPNVRPAFRLPPGIWIRPGLFYPMGEARGVRGVRTGVSGGGSPARAQASIYNTGAVQRVNRRTWHAANSKYTKGIASTNFLDAGIRRIAEETGKRYRAISEDFAAQELPKIVERNVKKDGKWQRKQFSTSGTYVRRRVPAPGNWTDSRLQATVRKQRRHYSAGGFQLRGGDVYPR